MAKHFEEKATEWEDITKEQGNVMSHTAMLKQLEREAEEDEEIYDQLARIYHFESNRYFNSEVAARRESVAHETGIGANGSSFGPYIKGTHHVEMHLHDSAVIELIVGEDHMHEKCGMTFLFAELPNMGFGFPAVPQSRTFSVPSVCSSVSKKKTAKQKQCGFILVFAELPAVLRNRISSVPATSILVSKEPQNKNYGFIPVFAELENVKCANLVASFIFCVDNEANEYLGRPMNCLSRLICHMCVSLTASTVYMVLCFDMNEIMMYVVWTQHGFLQWLIWNGFMMMSNMCIGSVKWCTILRVMRRCLFFSQEGCRTLILCTWWLYPRMTCGICGYLVECA